MTIFRVSISRNVIKWQSTSFPNLQRFFTGDRVPVTVTRRCAAEEGEAVVVVEEEEELSDDSLERLVDCAM